MQYNYIDRQYINRVILISDIHLGVRNASYEWIENTKNYFTKFFIPLLRKYKTEGDNICVIIAGDYFDNRVQVDINILNVGIEIMQMLTNECEVFISIGNHDIYKKKDTNITSIKIFESFPGVTVISVPTVVSVLNYKKFFIVPWVGCGPDETALLKKRKDDTDFAILHSDISGLNYDNGRQIINGVDASSYGTGRIYSGHIHKRQKSGAVTYIGSPYQLRRSDIGNDKGIYSIKISDDGTVREDFEINNYSSKFLRIQLVDILDITLEKLKAILENNYVDIIIKKEHKDNIVTAKLLDWLNECHPKRIEIILDKSSTIDNNKEVLVYTGNDILDIVKANIIKMGFSEAEASTILKTNENYLSQASDMLGGSFDDNK